MNKAHILCMAFVTSHLLGCASHSQVNFSVIQQKSQCAYTEAVIEQLDDIPSQTKLINRILPFSDPADRDELQTLFTRHAQQEKLFVIAQGTKPTPGYGFLQHADQAYIEHDILHLPIDFTRPSADSMLAQVLTSPCMVVGIDAKAEYKVIEVDNLRLTIQ